MKKSTNCSTPLLNSDFSSSHSSLNSKHNVCDDRLTDNHLSPNTRRPFHYPPDSRNIGRLNYGTHIADTDHTLDASVIYNRYLYYNRLSSSVQSSQRDDRYETIRIPDHVVPWYFYIPRLVTFSDDQTTIKQSSVVTIFAIWNMLMGTSLLCLPWAINKAGLVSGIILLLVMTGICFYTASLILSVPKLANLNVVEFTDACYHLFGRWTHVLTLFASLITLIGSCVVYWVLMSNFLYHVGSFTFQVIHKNMTISYNMSGVVCGKDMPDSNISSCQSLNLLYDGTNYLKYFYQSHAKNSSGVSGIDVLFARYWDLTGSVPLVLVVLMAPIVSLKSVNFFLKFNIVGSVSVMYLLIFSAFKFWQWGGVNINFVDTKSVHYAQLFGWDFPTLSGVLSLALFIHNIIISLMSTQQNPKNNKRDLGIAYTLVCLTYLLISCLIYLSFPLSRTCLSDNFIDNFASNDLLAFVTRVFLLLQIVCLYPLIVYMLRLQVMHLVIPNQTPTYFHIFYLNILLISLCVLFAVYFPRIGTIIRYCGSISGLIFIFAVPPLAYMRAKRINGQKVSLIEYCVHYIIILIGISNFLAQFFVN